MKQQSLKLKLVPLIVTPLVIAADQITKALVQSRFEMYRPVEVLGDLVRITLKRNTAMAFSIGHQLDQQLQRVVFLIVPLLVMVAVAVYYFRATDLSRGQRWMIAAVLGGGLGNYVDRIFRPEGVVDFVDVKFFGIFGLERWPTFNVADATVVVGGIVLVVSMVVLEARLKSRTETESKE